LVFLDINTFYGPRAGGIRTYHRAKLEWFAKQNDHVYCLIYPGPEYRVEKPSPGVYLVQVYGKTLTADPSGYRLMLDYRRVAQWIRKLNPDVIEAGDAWLTSWFCLWLRAANLWNGLLVSFYHSDPVPSYLMPWSRRGSFRKIRAWIASLGSNLFYSIQRRFDRTATASHVMEDSLRRHRVTRVRRLPFGVHASIFERIHSFEPLRRKGAADAPVRFLYAGRLDRDKGIELLLEILPALLENPSFRVTVAGRGAYADRFASIKHERFRFAGFLEGRNALAALYHSHDIFLAPGPHETFGLAVLESMASGLVAVAPSSGGSGELLSELDSPFRFMAGNARGFLEAIHRAASADLPLASEKHRELARRYGTWDQAVERMVAAWRELA
jgi:alpha-1,6-mannosyltransferase